MAPDVIKKARGEVKESYKFLIVHRITLFYDGESCRKYTDI